MQVRQAANVVELLELFARLKRPATLSEISQELGWPRSSTFNLIGTLTELGYLYEPRPRGGHYPTPRWQLVVGQVAAAEPVPQAVRRLLEELAAATGETVFVCGPAGSHAVVLDIVDSPAAIRYHVHVGKRLPIQATASGRAILSQYEPDERNAVLRRVAYERYQPTTLTDRASVEREIERSLERGFFQSLTEYTPDVSGIAVPLPLLGRRLAVAVAGPTFRVNPLMWQIGVATRDRIAAFCAADAGAAA